MEFGRDREGNVEVTGRVRRDVRNVDRTDRSGFDPGSAFEDQVGWLPCIPAPGPIECYGRTDRGAGR